MRALSKAAKTVEAGYRKSLELAIKMHHWYVACARIRDLAKLYLRYGKPYRETLEELKYDYYRTAIKRRYNEI